MGVPLASAQSSCPPSWHITWPPVPSLGLQSLKWGLSPNISEALQSSCDLSHHPQLGGILAPWHDPSTLAPPHSILVLSAGGSISPGPPGAGRQNPKRHGCSMNPSEWSRAPIQQHCGEVHPDEEGVWPWMTGKILPGKARSWIQSSLLGCWLKVFSANPCHGAAWHGSTRSATAGGSPSQGWHPGVRILFLQCFFHLSTTCPYSSLHSPSKQWAWLFPGRIWLFPYDIIWLSASHGNGVLQCIPQKGWSWEPCGRWLQGLVTPISAGSARADSPWCPLSVSVGSRECLRCPHP